MKLPRRTFLHLAAGAAALPLATHIAHGQTYPARPITLIVPYAAGGATDVMARIVSEHMSRTLGQRIIIENVTGAGGTIGSVRAMRAAPDGYTLIIGNQGTHAAAVGLYPRLAYNPENDFATIGVIGGPDFFVVGRKGLPPNNASEFFSYLKGSGEKLNVAHAGIGSTTHLTCLLLGSILDAKPTQVPFGGAAPAMNAVLAERVDYMCVTTPDVAQYVRSGMVKGYVVASPARASLLPDVPTSQEVGLPEFQVYNWNGLFAPKGTPRSILDILTSALDKALDDDTTRRRLVDIGNEIASKAQRGPASLAANVKADIARYTPVIRASGISIQ